MPNPLLDRAQDLFAGDVPPIDFHMHTSWTDGNHTVGEMHEAALRKGLECILFSEHARATSEDWFFDFVHEVRRLPDNSCRALVGVEARVSDFSGNIDNTREIIDACDLVMASVHRFPDDKGRAIAFDDIPADEAADIEMHLALAVLDNPDVDILGHPFGMSVARFKATPGADRFRAIAEKAARTGVAFEINSRYHDDPNALVDLCRQAGTRISLGSNAHDVSEVGHVWDTLKQVRASR